MSDIHNPHDKFAKIGGFEMKISIRWLHN